MNRIIECDECLFTGGSSRSLGVHKGLSHGDIDEIVVERLVSGRECEANPSERRAAGIVLIKRGYSRSYIAKVLGVSSRTVSRWRRDSGVTPGHSLGFGSSDEDELLVEEEWDEWRRSR